MKEANREVLDRGSLAELLVNRARQATDRRLTMNAVGGLAIAAAVAVLRPVLWIPLAALALAIGAFGIWGILDRELLESEAGGRTSAPLNWARGIVGAVGGIAAGVSGLTLFFALLGTIIS